MCIYWLKWEKPNVRTNRPYWQFQESTWFYCNLAFKFRKAQHLCHIMFNWPINNISIILLLDALILSSLTLSIVLGYKASFLFFWHSEPTCSFTHWMVVIAAPLWSLITLVVAPFTVLLTAKRPFFPAERITWPTGQKRYWAKLVQKEYISCHIAARVRAKSLISELKTAISRLHIPLALLLSLTISRVLDGSDSHVMGMQLHLHLWGGELEDPQSPITVSCSHPCTALAKRRAPAYAATGLIGVTVTFCNVVIFTSNTLTLHSQKTVLLEWLKSFKNRSMLSNSMSIGKCLHFYQFLQNQMDLATF